MCGRIKELLSMRSDDACEVATERSPADTSHGTKSFADNCFANNFVMAMAPE